MIIPTSKDTNIMLEFVHLTELEPIILNKCICCILWSPQSKERRIFLCRGAHDHRSKSRLYNTNPMFCKGTYLCGFICVYVL